MTIGSWDPQAAQVFSINPVVLAKFAQIASSNLLENISAQLSIEEIQELAPIMRLDYPTWEQISANIDNEDLINLIRFFTIAEEHLSGWEGQEKSPVIYINKVLKQRGAPLNKEMLLWIRANSSNRFLPNGAL